MVNEKIAEVVCKILAGTQSVIGLLIVILSFSGVSTNGGEVSPILTIVVFVSGTVTIFSGFVLSVCGSFFKLVISEEEYDEN